MITFMDFMVFLGMVLLRVGVPVAITAGAVFLLKRLDRRWAEEAREQQRAAKGAEQPAERPAKQVPGEQPVTPKRVPIPAPQLPFVPPAAIPQRPQIGATAQPGLAASPAGQRCWDVKGCSEAGKAQCAAPSHPDLPCWKARLDAEGHIPETCVSCETFQRYPLM